MLFVYAGLFYFLPSVIGFATGKRNAGAIFVLNLFLGWTFVGWIVALVWALTAETSVPHQLALPTAHWCSACRAPISTGQRFCHVCGTAIAWPAALHS